MTAIPLSDQKLSEPLTNRRAAAPGRSRFLGTLIGDRPTDQPVRPTTAYATPVYQHIGAADVLSFAVTGTPATI